MPTVPVIDQTAAPASQYSAGQVTPERNYQPQQQIAQGQAMQQAGEVAYTTGATIGDKLAAQVDDATVKNAETGFLTKVTDILHNPQTGYLNQRGQNAIDQYGATNDAVAKASQEAIEATTNPIQKHMLQQVLNQHVLNTSQQVFQHNYQQTAQYSGEAAVNRANTAATTAGLNAKDYATVDADGKPTGPYAQAVLTAEQEAGHASMIMKGAPPKSPTYEEGQLLVHNQIATGTLSQMVNSRLPAAQVQRTYDDMKAKNWIDLRDGKDPLGRMVKTYTEQENLRIGVSDALSDADRKAKGQPTTSTGTPDYHYIQTGAAVSSQPYNPAAGTVTVNSPQNSPIQAPAGGTVKQVGKDEDDNFTLTIQHPDGSTTKIAGLNTASVKVGDSIGAGETIATSGGVVQWGLADKNGAAVDPTKTGLPAVDTSRIIDEPTLHAAIDNIRQKFTDPYLQQQAIVQAESIVRHNQQMDNAAKAQQYNLASQQFAAAGDNVRGIDSALFHSLPPDKQLDFRNKQTERVIQLTNQSEFFKTQAETDQIANWDANPDLLTVHNVKLAEANLSRSSFLSQMSKAAALEKAGTAGVVEANAVTTRMRYFGEPAGVNFNPKPWDTAGKTELNQFHYAVDNAINQIKTQNHGKATAQQVDDAIKQVLIQKPINTGPSALFNWTGMGSPSNTEKKFAFQIPPGTNSVVPGSDGKMHYTDGKNDLGVVQ